MGAVFIPNLSGEETELREVEEIAPGSTEGNGERRTGRRLASLCTELHQGSYCPDRGPVQRSPSEWQSWDPVAEKRGSGEKGTH